MRASNLLRGLAVLACLTTAAAWAAPAGEVEFTRGVGTAQKADGSAPARIVGKGSTVDRGDRVSTGADSYTVMKLSDGTRITVRPNSQFVVQNYEFKPQARADESTGVMVLGLLKGGLRTLTGLIAKRDLNAARMTTPMATVGIRGTDFDARICENDCAQEEQRLKAAGAKKRSNVILASARVLRIQGKVEVVGADQLRRLLAQGGPVYPGDTIETAAGAYVVLVFRDQTKMTIQPATRFKVEDFVFDAKSPREGRMLVSLLKGGLRAFTGLIGKANYDNVAVRTANATVGIRGTGFDLYCQGTCAGEPPTPENDGLTGFVWDGSIWIDFSALCGGGAGGGLGGGEAGGFGGCSGGLVKLPGKPKILDFDTPRPDGVPGDFDLLFGLDELPDGSFGLYIVVRDGHIQIILPDGRVLDLGKGEVGFTDGKIVLRPLEVPLFLDEESDPDPRLLELIRSTGVNAECRP